MKSHEQDLLAIVAHILKDVGDMCQPNKKTSLNRDLKTIRKRFTHEGVQFLALTLPAFGTEFLRCLENGRIGPTNFAGWRRWRRLPAFLRGFVELVFDAGTGGLRDDPDISAIEGIYQITCAFKKLPIPCSSERNSMALSGFAEVECAFSDTMLPRDIDLYDQVVSLLWGNVLGGSYDPLGFIPKHGPGFTAEGITGNRKYSQRVWYERLEPFFPSDAYLMSCVSHAQDADEGLDSVHYVPEAEELPVKVALVPKTLKGPRIIAMEPVCMQYAQQALAGHIRDSLESHDVTRGHLNFRDQSVNQRLAMEASVTGDQATLDLSDASDRVPLSLALRMFQCNPDLRDAIDACRSRVARLPGGELIHLQKFASMGSALCFPIEAMYFFSVLLVARFRKHQLPVSVAALKYLSRDLYVYGDDIIVPADEVEVICETLADYNCKVSPTKSYWMGKFRESCGMDAYDGKCVTPTYIRSLRPTGKEFVSAVISRVATRNQLYLKGYWRTANYLKHQIEKLLRRKLPVTMEESAGIGWVSFLNRSRLDSRQGAKPSKNNLTRWNSHLQRPEVWTFVVKSVTREDRLSGYSAMLKCLLRLEDPLQKSAVGNQEEWSRRNENYAGRTAPRFEYRKDLDDVCSDHLSKTPRSGLATLKSRWVSPY